MTKAKLLWMVIKMTDKKEFAVNDKSLALFLKSHGIKLVEMKNGKYIFEYDDLIEEKLDLFEEMQARCLF